MPSTAAISLGIGDGFRRLQKRLHDNRLIGGRGPFGHGDAAEAESRGEGVVRARALGRIAAEGNCPPGVVGCRDVRNDDAGGAAVQRRGR